MPISPSAVRWKLLNLLLVGAGCSASIYLFVRYLMLHCCDVPGGIDVCTKVFGSGCDATLLSEQAIQLGIPIAGWGVVFYVCLAVLLILGSSLGQSFERETALAAFMLAVPAAILSAVLSVLMATGKTAFCPLCVVVHFVNFALVPSLKRLNARSMDAMLADLGRVGRYLMGAKVAAPTEASWKVVGFINVALVAIVAYQWIYVETRIRAKKSAPDAPPLISAEESIKHFDSTPVKDILVTDDDPRHGPSDAPAQLVIFSSFRCTGCRTFSMLANQLTQSFQQGELSLVFKHFTLHEVCSVEHETDSASGACATAYAAEAARRQGKFWPFHDALFATELDGSDESILNGARTAGLDVSQFESDRNTAAVRAKVVADVELAQKVGVTATPTVFLNGKQLRPVDLNLQSLFVLISYEMLKKQRFTKESTVH